MDLHIEPLPKIPSPDNEPHIRELRATPLPDKRRVRIYLETDPFQLQNRFSIDLSIQNAEGEEVATSSVVDSMTRKVEITIHLRLAEPRGRYTLLASLFYSVMPSPDESAPDKPLPPIERKVIDTKEINFTVE